MCGDGGGGGDGGDSVCDPFSEYTNTPPGAPVGGPVGSSYGDYVCSSDWP